jgi:putative tryptophan/tyrosine transport system substrate-binding protein
MSDMRRREFTALVGGVGLLLAVKVRRAWGEQPSKIPRIGILDDTPMWQPFRQALHELGYVEGQNIAYEYRYGEGAPDRLATVAAELVRRPVDLIATYGTQATHAAKEATATIPIVMIGVGDPVRAGLVESLARPGGNITGNTVLSPDLGPKRLQILREVIAKVERVVYLANPDNASNMAALAETKIAASEAGTVLIPVEVRAVGDFDPAFAAIMLSIAAGASHRTIRRWRHVRYRRTPDGTMAVGALRPAIRDRGPTGSRQQYWHRGGRARIAGRLYAAHSRRHELVFL